VLVDAPHGFDTVAVVHYCSACDVEDPDAVFAAVFDHITQDIRTLARVARRGGDTPHTPMRTIEVLADAVHGSATRLLRRDRDSGRDELHLLAKYAHNVTGHSDWADARLRAQFDYFGMELSDVTSCANDTVFDW
jgi:glucose-6-phosphate-specific signal transduction histidine kinase